MTEAKKDLSRVGLTMVAATAVFWLVPRIVVYGYIFLFQGGDIEHANVNLWIQMLPTYLISMPLILFLLSRLPGEEIQKRKIKPWHFIGCVSGSFGIMIACNCVGLFLTFIIGLLIRTKVDNTMVSLVSQINPLMSLLLVSIAAPVYEELIFRKMIISRTVKYGEGTAVLLSGLMFGLFHGNLNQFAYAFGLGLFLAFIFVKTGNIRITIAIHMIVNASTSLVLTGLMKMLGIGDLLNIYMDYMQTGDMSAITVYYMSHLGAFALIALYLIAEFAVAITGIVLLIVFSKQFKCAPGKVRIEKGQRFKTVICNLGIALFIVIWVCRIILQLFGI